MKETTCIIKASCGCGFTTVSNDFVVIQNRAFAHVHETGHTVEIRGEIRVKDS